MEKIQEATLKLEIVRLAVQILQHSGNAFFDQEKVLQVAKELESFITA
jgi:hypothetical protein